MVVFVAVATPSVSTQSSLGSEGDPELLKWLRLHGADADSIDRVNSALYLLLSAVKIASFPSLKHAELPVFFLLL